MHMWNILLILIPNEILLNYVDTMYVTHYTLRISEYCKYFTNKSEPMPCVSVAGGPVGANALTEISEKFLIINIKILIKKC